MTSLETEHPTTQQDENQHVFRRLCGHCSLGFLRHHRHGATYGLRFTTSPDCPASWLESSSVEAGTTVTLHDAFCDNDGLAEIRWDLHTAEGHSQGCPEHEAEEHEGEEEHEEEFILWSGRTGRSSRPVLSRAPSPRSNSRLTCR